MLPLINLFTALLFITNLAAASLAGAAPTTYDQVDPCQQIVVVGDPDWVPYTTQQQLHGKGAALTATDEDISHALYQELISESAAEPGEQGVTPKHQPHVSSIYGVGIELVKEIFAKMDISVKEIEFSDRRSILHGLRLGDIDILVSLYPDREYSRFLDIIEPGYQDDPITVLMRKDNSLEIKRWDDLIGKRGVTTSNFELEQNFADYAKRYLYVHQKTDLISTLNLIKQRKADYMLGSKAQLEYAIKISGSQDDLELVSWVVSPGSVHIGVSKKSACHAYVPFLSKAIAELKAAGEINKKVEDYLIKVAPPSPTTPAEEQPASEFDYLFN